MYIIHVLMMTKKSLILLKKLVKIGILGGNECQVKGDADDLGNEKQVIKRWYPGV